MNFILLQTDEVISKALEINPYGTAAIGVLIALLITIIVYQHKDSVKERDYSKELSERVIEISTKINTELDSDKLWKDNLRKKFNDLSTEIKLLEQSVRNHFPDKFNEKI